MSTLAESYGDDLPGLPRGRTRIDTAEVRDVQRTRVLRAAIGAFAELGFGACSVSQIVDEYLAWLTDLERSPNTVEAYAHDLRLFWMFLAEYELAWDLVGVMELAEFGAWARRPASNVVVISDQAARLSPTSVNRMLTAVVGF